MLGVALEGDGNWNTNTIGFISPLHLLYPLLPFLDIGQVSGLSYPLSTSASCVSSIHTKLSIFCINTVLCTFTLFPSYLFFLPPLLNLPLPEMTVTQLIKHCTAGCSHFTSLHSLRFLKFLAQYLLGLQGVLILMMRCHDTIHDLNPTRPVLEISTHPTPQSHRHSSTCSKSLQPDQWN